MNNLRFSINENGILTEYKILKLLAPPNGKYQYVIYTKDDGNTYASRYEITNGNVVLKPIEEEYEWQYVDKYIGGEE